jgi:hypothetical protein
MIITLRSILDEIVEHNCVDDCDRYNMLFDNVDAIDSLATTIANFHEHQSEASCAVAIFESADKTKCIMLGVSVAEDQNGMPFYNVKLILYGDNNDIPHDTDGVIDHRYSSLAINKLWYKFHTLCLDIRSSCRMLCDTLV